MLKDCLNNFIGVRGLYEDVTSDSGLYINDLPSVSLKMLANLSDGETKDFTGLIDSIETLAFNQFESDVMNKAQKFFKTNVLLENDISGTYKEPYEVVNSSAEYKGVSIQVRDNISKYLSVYINTIQIYLDGAISTDILIYNTLTGVLMDSIPFDGLVGMNRININKSYPTYGQETNIFICYNGTSVNSIKVDNVDYSETAIIRGAKVSTVSSVIDSNLVFNGDSYGLVVDYNIRCDISEFICSSRDLFKYAIWWKIGSAIMFERMTSQRMNKYTLNKTAAELKELWEYYEKQYDDIMLSVMSNLNKNEDKVCFECSRQRSYKYLKP